jgi:hypothetical protein
MFKKNISFFLLLMLVSSCDDRTIDTSSYQDTAAEQGSSEIAVENSENNVSSSNIQDSETDLNNRIECPNCNGAGNLTCSKCNGNGRAHCSGCGGDGWDKNGLRCLKCDGNGIVNCETTASCSTCNGYGYGQLKMCSFCNGTTKNEQGESCVCMNPMYDISAGIIGIFSSALGVNSEHGTYIEGYPGYLFFPPDN